MPSWNDGESSEERLGDLTPLDFAPNTIEDPTFFGIASACDHVCDGHGLKPRKCVAFQGVDTGRRFYMCPIENEIMNCGFVSWIDPDWPLPLQHALGRLWAMHDEINMEKNEQGLEHYRKLQEVSAEKKKLEKEYNTLVDDVNRMMDRAEKRAVEVNLAKMKEEEEKAELKKHRNMLLEEVAQLKDFQKHEEEKTKLRMEQWDKEREDLKEQKRKLEYQFLELFNANDVNKDKLRRMKQIMDE